MEAIKPVSKIHHRMPVILDSKTKDLWLDPNVKFNDCFNEILTSTVYEGLDFYEVGEIVNSVKNDKPECLMKKEDYDEMVHQRGLGRFFTKVPKVDILTEPT